MRKFSISVIGTLSSVAVNYANKIGKRSKKLLHSQRGQGTTEYAILVGVLVVIAILAILAFRDNIQALWDAITDGINSL